MAKSKTQNPNHTTLDGEALLDDYVLTHSDDEPEYLYKLWRATNVHIWRLWHNFFDFFNIFFAGFEFFRNFAH